MSSQAEKLVEVVLDLAEIELETRQVISSKFNEVDVAHLKAAFEAVKPLLLAAPEMLDALKAVETSLAINELYKKFEPLLKTVKAAITRAEAGNGPN